MYCQGFFVGEQTGTQFWKLFSAVLAALIDYYLIFLSLHERVFFFIYKIPTVILNDFTWVEKTQTRITIHCLLCAFTIASFCWEIAAHNYLYDSNLYLRRQWHIQFLACWSKICSSVSSIKQPSKTSEFPLTNSRVRLLSWVENSCNSSEQSKGILFFFLAKQKLIKKRNFHGWLGVGAEVLIFEISCAFYRPYHFFTVTLLWYQELVSLISMPFPAYETTELMHRAFP